MDDSLVLVGANPGLRLTDAGGRVVAFASAWRVDWSTRGSGNVLVLCRPAGVTVVGDDETLGSWLADAFVRHFPEAEGLPWRAPQFRSADVELSLDLDRGLVTRGGGIEMRVHDVLDVRTVAVDEFPLRTTHRLRLVLAPCAQGSLALDGRQVDGVIETADLPGRGPSSSAWLAVAETWHRS